jgi:CRP/FNR family transcriptional regulator, cyclic AMP receptor protein
MNDRARAASDCIDFLSLLAEPKRGAVLAGSRRVEYRAGTAAVMSTQPDYAVVIEQGLVRVYVEAASGRQATVFYVHPSELLTYGLMGRPAIRVHVQAVTDAWLRSLDVDHLRELSRHDADVSLALLTYYAGLLAHSTRTIAVRSLGDITDRLVFDLLERACTNQLRSGQLVVRASQQELANSIGSVREVVARSLRKLRDSGVVATGPSLVRVLDVVRLETMVNDALV